MEHRDQHFRQLLLFFFDQKEIPIQTRRTSIALFSQIFRFDVLKIVPDLSMICFRLILYQKTKAGTNELAEKVPDLSMICFVVLGLS